MTSTDGARPAYRPVPAHIDLSQLEREIMQLWTEQGTFEATLKATEGAPRWTFYEGPPTANGMPGSHHVEARTFKDVFPRFKTMQGYHVERKAGWDCHGLPVEIAVEKELGFNGKPDIEVYGIAEFNAQCRESVMRHVDAWEGMTQRMGYWTDMSDPYRTMDPAYVESVWWGLSQIFDKGLLVEDFRVAPYCPRCGTTLSDHELAQGYETITDPSIYVRFPLTSGPYAGQASLLIWTTTPWTLVSNALVAAKADVTYVTATNGTETVVVAEQLVEHALGDGWTVQDTFTGADMVGWTYQRPFEIVEWPERVEGPARTSGPLRRQRGLRHHHRRHRPRAPVARVRRGRLRVRAAQRHRHGQPHRRGRPLRGGARPRGRRLLPRCQRRPARPTSPIAACCSTRCRTSTPIRTAGGATRR